MSKKNNKGTKKRVHAADLAREKADAAARAAKAAKRAAREARREEEAGKGKNSLLSPSLHVTSGGRVLKKQKRNTLARAVKRVKKGSRVNGIRVVDSETKAAARAAVRAAAALAMEVDDDKGGNKNNKTSVPNKKKKKKLPAVAAAAASVAVSKDKVMADA